MSSDLFVKSLQIIQDHFKNTQILPVFLKRNPYWQYHEIPWNIIHMFVLEEKSPLSALEIMKYVLVGDFNGAGLKSQGITQVIVKL